MRIRLVSVGRLGRSPVADAIRDYESRVGRYWSFDAVEVRQEPARDARPEEVREREWGRLCAAVVGDLVTCDERGRSLTSHEFAELLATQADAGHDVTFVVGGAFGLPDDAHRSAAVVLALAPWTLSHDLARLVLAEQLYRAGTILRGEPYHK